MNRPAWSVGASLIGSLLWAVAPAGAASSGKPLQDCADVCPSMQVIPAGSFTMGSPPTEEGRTEGSGAPHGAAGKPNRELQHPVHIGRPFALSVDPITRRQYGQFVEATGYHAAGACFGINEKGEASSSDAFTWQTPGFPQSDNDPVVCVSPHDADAYVKWLSQKTGKDYRLPTEAEYEFAARAGTTTARYWGDSADEGCAYANGVGSEASKIFFGTATACDDGHVLTAPVGSYKPNAFGLYDMLGNVWVYMADCWHDTYEGAPSDGSAWREAGCMGRVMRGGSFVSNKTSLRSAARHEVDNLDARVHNYGIRVARSL